MLNDADIEKMFVDSGAKLQGHFLLTSGKHSDQYMQCAQILKNPLYTERLARYIAEKYEDQKVGLVLGPAMGGVILAYEVARQLKVEGIFCERESGKMALRRGFEIKPGQRVLVVEDVITTGGSLREAMEVVRQHGGIVVGVAVLVDRSGGREEFGVKKEAVMTMDITAWEEESCPLCKEGKIPAVKPGSRSL